MKILIIAQRCPYPPNKGEKIRTFHHLRFMVQHGHEIILASPYEDDSDLIYFDELAKRDCSKVLNAKLAAKPIRLITGALSNKALSVSNFYSSKLQSKIDFELSSQKIDVIFCSASSVAEYVFQSNVLRYLDSPPKLIMDFMDVDSDKWTQYKKSNYWPLSMVYGRESKLITKFEGNIINKFDHCLLITQTEVDVFESIHGSVNNLTAVENGLDTSMFYPPNRPRNIKDPYFLFAGVMDYAPNIDAVIWFMDCVWPTIKKQWPQAKFCIAGMNPTDKIKKLEKNHGVEVTGFVDDIKPYFDKTNIFVAPFRIARGVQNKVLQAFASGLPVIATSMGAEGIRYHAEQDILLADTPQQYIDKIGLLINNEQIYRSLSDNGLQNITQNYSWDSILKPLILLLNDKSKIT
jgi:sugar transferase (PEP-CTERM/EpsH1 system associated)